MADTSATPPKASERVFEGKVAWVVGASKGIGADTARLFGRRGATVIVSSRDAAGLDQVVEDIRADGGQGFALPLDISDEAAVVDAGRQVWSRNERLDFAFNNAAEGCTPTPLAELPTSAFDRVFAVTVRGTFLAMKEQVPAMIRSGGGAIVNMSSTAGMSAYRGGSPYVAAKHAILGLTKAAALDYAERGVRVNAVAPGPIDTHRLQAAPESYRERARGAVPMRRLGLGSEVGEAVVWLCSPASAFITGATLAIDGGRLAGSA